VHAVPLTDVLQRSITHLQQWISSLNHQQQVSRILFAVDATGQLTLKQAFCRAINGTTVKCKYPQ